MFSLNSNRYGNYTVDLQFILDSTSTITAVESETDHDESELNTKSSNKETEIIIFCCITVFLIVVALVIIILVYVKMLSKKKMLPKQIKRKLDDKDIGFNSVVAKQSYDNFDDVLASLGPPKKKEVDFDSELQSLNLFTNDESNFRKQPTIKDERTETFDKHFLQMTFKGKFGNQYKDSMCHICLEEFEIKEKIRKIQACRHIFHKDCLEVWLCKERKCPLCLCDLSEKTLAKMGPYKELTIIESQNSLDISVGSFDSAEFEKMQSEYKSKI